MQKSTNTDISTEQYMEQVEKVTNMAVALIQSHGDYLKFRSAVNDLMKDAGANTTIENTLESIRERRRIVADAIVIRAITPLSASELKHLEKMLHDIADQDAPSPARRHGFHR